MKCPAEKLSDRSKRNAETGCLEWIAAKSKAGYGQFRLNGKTVYAHRVSYELHYGKSPQGLVVCHKCDNPACIEPLHLFLGTHADNMRDCASKNRTSHQFGEISPRSKLTNEQAREIWAKRKAGTSNVELARQYNIDATVISRIANGKAWPHIHAEMSA